MLVQCEIEIMPAVQIKPSCLTHVVHGAQVNLRLTSGNLVDSDTFGMDGA